jgi:hypothetical protein
LDSKIYNPHYAYFITKNGNTCIFEKDKFFWTKDYKERKRETVFKKV